MKHCPGIEFSESRASITMCQKRHVNDVLEPKRDMSLTEAAKETVYLRRFLIELGFESLGSVELLSDNNGAQKLAKNPIFHNRTKHIDLKHHLVRDILKNEDRFQIKQKSQPVGCSRYRQVDLPIVHSSRGSVGESDSSEAMRKRALYECFGESNCS